MSHRVHVLISGRVQGVGFRYATYSEAMTLQLRGWVRNLYDGRVEAEFESDDKAVLDQMIAWCRQGPRWAQVDAVQIEWAEGDSHYPGFVIRG